MMPEDAGENAVARIASPCPDIVAEHLDTARTRNTACGVYCNIMLSSVVFSPGLRTEEYTSVSTSSSDDSVSGEGRTSFWKKNR